MSKSMGALCASTFLALALAGTACAAAGQGEQTEKIEPAPISEGVDTSCEVSFARYTGSYKDLFLHQDVPVAFGFPAGHGDTNYPLLMGATAHLSVSNDSFTLGWS